MPYFDPNKYFIEPEYDPYKNLYNIGINFRKPKTIDDLTIWRNHLDLFEISYIVCIYSDDIVKLKTDNYIAIFDALDNYKFIGIE